ncbi:MAG: LPS export ABC transporter periplasmic protein LptC [Phycisphaerales bacterium]|nr:LPS export ABC transporter periplasmic protein LptC [Phycisphaerales bacterium]
MTGSRRPHPRRGLSTITWAVMSGVLLSLVVILVGWFMEPEPTRDRRRHRQLDVTDLVTPEALTESERERASTSPESSNVKLEDGAWVQVADSDGRLQQQYSAERIDPLPDGWLQMTRPRAMIFLEGGKVVTLRGEHGLVNVPQQAIQSGTLEGDVVIRIFAPVDDQPVRIESSEPEVILRTDKAMFDNSLGEVRCDRAIRIDAEGASFAGIGLSMLLGEGERTIERLVVNESTEPIRVQRAITSNSTDQVSEPAVSPGSTSQEPVPAPASAPRFYQLELEKDVRIEEFASSNAPTPQRVVRGDQLTAIFSLDGQGFNGAASPSVTPSTAGESSAMSRGPLLAGMALGQSVDQDSAGSEELEEDTSLVLIHYTGRLVMLPAPESDMPRAADDVHIDITADTGRVEINDVASKAVIGCQALAYRSDKDLIELSGAPGRPLTVASPRLNLEGDRFRLSRREGSGRLSGPGSMWFSNARDSELTIDWTGGVDLKFMPGTEKLQQAIFAGAVRVDNEEFDLSADTLDVQFVRTEGDARDAIETILAKGTDSVPAIARRKSELGILEARMIDLALTRDKDGRTLPEILRAEGRVRAENAEQTLWAKALDVRFAPAPDRPKAKAVSAPERTDDAVDMGMVELDRVKAVDGVQVRLADGARVWADTLEGRGKERTLTLESRAGDLLLIRGNVIADQLRELRFNERDRKAVAGGPGRFRYFDEPIPMRDDGPLVAPDTFEMPPSMEATWGQRMEFDDLANEGAGAIELLGDVIVRNRPDVLEANDLDADRLLIDLARRTDIPIIDEVGNPPSKDQLTAFSGSRDMNVLTADGNARLESRSWSDPERTSEPELFRITGPFIRYDATTGEGQVKGAGQLLVNQVPDTSAGGQPAADRDGMGVAIGGDGTTRFTWKKKMQMRRQVADRFLVSMSDGVEVLHAGLRPEDTMTLSADLLEVLMKRPDPGTDSKEPASGRPSDSSLDLGGQAEILRVAGRGRVFVRTPEQDVECEVFEYDAENQIALLSARDGRLVTVLSKGAATPVRAESVTWDMRTGRIQITGAVGSGGR